SPALRGVLQVLAHPLDEGVETERGRLPAEPRRPPRGDLAIWADEDAERERVDAPGLRDFVAADEPRERERLLGLLDRIDSPDIDLEVAIPDVRVQLPRRERVGGAGSRSRRRPRQPFLDDPSRKMVIPPNGKSRDVPGGGF